jgi:hypothetical protein
MTTTESTIISPTHLGLDDLEAPQPTPRPRRRRRAALAVLGAAIVLVAALLAGALTGGGRTTADAAVDEAEATDGFSTNEPGVETSSTVVERDLADSAGDSEADDSAAALPDAGEQSGDGEAPPPGALPAHLGASTASLAFGQHATKKTFTIENDGGAPLSWDAQESKPWMTVDPSQGDLAAGASQVIEVSVHRAGMPGGTSFQGDLTIDSDGGDAIVHVTGSTPFDIVQPVPASIESVNHMPVICSANSPKGPKTTPIVAKVSGPDIDGVKLMWNFGAGWPTVINMVKSGPDTWMVPSFGNLPQSVVKIWVYVENQYGDDTVQQQINVVFCP